MCNDGVFPEKLDIGHFIMVPFDYNYQNHSVFWFSCGLELPTVINFPMCWDYKIFLFEFKGENEMNSRSCSQMTPSKMAYSNCS